MEKPTILVVGTLDTKLEETLYLRDQIIASNACSVKVFDVGRVTSDDTKRFEPEELITPKHGSAFSGMQRAEYIQEMINLCIPIVQDLVSSSAIQGIISAGGSSGSSLATALMRNCCPVGFPKLQVSTMASGDMKHYIEETDITMMYSVVDIAGINSILKRILGNAAGAIVGMTTAYAKSKAEMNGHATQGKRIAVTMFGVTTPCVDHIRRILDAAPHEPGEHEVYVFHATGAGGLAMERLISEGNIDAVIDLTTTEIADHLFGGVLSAGPSRMDAAAKKGIPQVISVGALDMVNFGPKDSVPDKYKDRNLYEHNPAVTLMRTTKEENHQMGHFIVDKLKTATNPSSIKVLLPLGGVSMIDKPDQPFNDPEADKMLFDTIEDGLDSTDIEVEKYAENINDEVFAAQIARSILELMGTDPRKYRLANHRRRRWSFDHGSKITGVPRRPSKTET